MPKQLSRLPGAVEAGAQDCANTTPDHIEAATVKTIEYTSTAARRRGIEKKRRVIVARFGFLLYKDSPSDLIELFVGVIRSESKKTKAADANRVDHNDGL